MYAKTAKNEQRRRRPGGALVAVTAVVAAAAASLLVPLSGTAQPQAAPTNTAPPTITGIAAKGETLAASTGTWSGTPPIDFSYRWLRCDDDGADCDEIAAATNATYVLVDGDVGHRIRVRVTASNGEGTATVLSEATAEVSAGGAPKNTGEPRTSGSPVEGQTLSATTGTWTGSAPITFAYQWVKCGVAGGRPDASNCAMIAGATSSTYILTAAEVGTRIRVVVRATNASGSAQVASNPTQLVQAGKAPVNTKLPSVLGSMVEGSTVTVNRGTWTGATAFSYQWLRCNSGGGNCGAIAGSTGTQYRLAASDVGRKVRVNVTARNSAGATTRLSVEPATVAPAGPAGVIVLPSGERSIPATSVSRTERLVVTEVRFSPNPVRSRTAPVNIRVRVKDTRGYVVRDALVFVRSTPLVTRGQNRLRTAADGWVSYTVSPRFNFPQPRNGFNVQFFVKAYRAGDDPLAGVAGYRLVQVRLAR